MLEINIKDYRFRNEKEDTMLVFNVITSEMIFLKGKSKEFIQNLLENKESNEKISEKNLEILKNKKIITGD